MQSKLAVAGGVVDAKNLMIDDVKPAIGSGAIAIQANGMGRDRLGRIELIRFYSGKWYRPKDGVYLTK